MAASEVVKIEIETAIRPQSWATVQVGQKSLHTIMVDFKGRTITETWKTGNTHIGPIVLSSVRDGFRVENTEFPTSSSARFDAIGQTASGVGIMPDIDYKLQILLNQAPNLITISGAHDGYPSYNVAVNGVSVYDYTQGCITQLMGKADVAVMRKSIPWK